MQRLASLLLADAVVVAIICVITNKLLGYSQVTWQFGAALFLLWGGRSFLTWWQHR